MKQLPGQMRIVFKQNPLPASMHPFARGAALASIAAQNQGKFWEYHDTLFENQQHITREDLTSWAKVVGLDLARFEKDMADPATSARIDADQREANLSGASGTPTIFLNGRRVKGSLSSADAVVDLIKSEILKEE